MNMFAILAAVFLPVSIAFVGLEYQLATMTMYRLPLSVFGKGTSIEIA